MQFTYYSDFITRKRIALVQWAAVCGINRFLDLTNTTAVNTWISEYYCAMASYAWDHVNRWVKDMGEYDNNCPDIDTIAGIYIDFERQYMTEFGITSLGIEDDSIIAYRAKKSYEYWSVKLAQTTDMA